MNQILNSKILFYVTTAAIFITAAGCAGKQGHEEVRQFIVSQFELNRTRTTELIEKVEGTNRASYALRWIPPTERVCFGWQFLHIAAAEDNLANKYLREKALVSKELNEFSSREDKKQVCENLPELDVIKKYLADSRRSLLEATGTIDFEKLDEKPTEAAWGTTQELLNVYLWHEGHHQGQAHITFNMYKAEFKLDKKK